MQKHLPLITANIEFEVERTPSPMNLTEHQEFLPAIADSDSDLDAMSESSLSSLSDEEETEKIPKPPGEAGRPGRGGYKLVDQLKWDAAEYDALKASLNPLYVLVSNAMFQAFVYRNIKQNLDESSSFSNQDKLKIDLVCIKVC